MGWLTGWEDDNWNAPTDGGGFFRRLFGLGDDRYASRLARETEQDLRQHPNWRAGQPLRDDQRSRDVRVRDTQHYMGRDGGWKPRPRDSGGRFSHRDDDRGGGGFW